MGRRKRQVPDGVEHKRLSLNMDRGLAKGLQNVVTVLAAKVSWKREG
jgi:hypothetical protein